MNNNYTIKEMPIEERPREKIINYGINSLSNAELVAVLLRTGHQQKSAIDLAQELLNTFGGLTEVNTITYEELIKIKGIGRSKACQLLASVEIAKRLSSYKMKRQMKIKKPSDLNRYLKDELRNLKKEKFMVILLNVKNEVISKNTISIGNLDTSIVHPREVFNIAIKKSAASMILVHNHPSGDPTPSTNDKNITNRLLEVGKIVGIDILDHLIFGDNCFYSFKEHELI